MNAATRARKAWEPEQIARDALAGGAYARGPGVLQARPIAAQRVGQIIACCSNVENDLIESFAYMVDAEEWLAAELLHDVRGAQRVHKIFEGAVLRRFGKEAANRIGKALGAFHEISAHRNDFAHRRLIVPQHIEGAVILEKGWGANQTLLLFHDTTLEALVAEVLNRAGLVARMLLELRMSSPTRYVSGSTIYGAQPLRPEDIARLLAEMDAEFR